MPYDDGSLKEHEAVCRECGDVVDIESAHYDDTDGEYVCDDCYYEYDMVTCDDCGAITTEYVTINPGTRGEHDVCYDCATDYSRCYCCGHYYDHGYIWGEDDDRTICEQCQEMHGFSCCFDCGAILDPEDVCRVGGNTYCSSCAPERRPIHGWDYRPDFRFLGDGDLFMGVELEVDKEFGEGDECAEAILKVTNDVYCKHDGSLECGFETNSHPATLGYHMNTLPWRDIMDTAIEHGFKSHDAGTCGLHVHVNRNFFHPRSRHEQDFAAAKAIILIDRLWREFVTFSRRDYHQAQRWAKKPNIAYSADDNDITLVSKASELKCDRYQAVNISNAHTIEFRLFRGTLKYQTFIATLQMVDTLCRFVADAELDDVLTATFQDLVKDTQYAELREYCIERGLLEREEQEVRTCA